MKRMYIVLIGLASLLLVAVLLLAVAFPRYAALIGPSTDRGKCVVIMRATHGASQMYRDVTILDREFQIDVGEPVERRKVAADRIKTIVFKSLPTYATDMLRTVSGTELNGSVVNDSIHFRSDDFEEPITVPTAAVISIIWHY